MTAITKDDVDRQAGWTMAQAMGAQGITPAYLAKKLKAELNAKELRAVVVIGGDEEGGRERIKESVPAWGVRQKARQDAHRLRGDYPAEQVEVSGDPLRPLFRISLDGLSEEERLAMAKAARAMLREQDAGDGSSDRAD